MKTGDFRLMENRGKGTGKQEKRNVKGYIRKLGLKKKVILFSVLIFFMTFLISFASFGMLQYYSWHQTAVSYVENAQNEKLDALGNYFTGLKNLTYNIAYSNWMQDLCQQGIYTQRRQELLDNAHNFLSNLSTLYDGNQFALIALNGTRVTSADNYRLDYDRDISQKEWYETLLHDGVYYEAAAGKEKGIYRKHEEWDLTLYYVINDYNTLERTGFFVITIPEKNLADLLKTEQEEIGFGLLCSDGKLLFSSGPQEERLRKAAKDSRFLEKPEKLDRNFYASEKKFVLGALTWDLFTVFDGRGLKADSGILSLVFLLMLLLTGGLLTIVAVTVSRYLTKPILDCAGAMGKIKDNQFGIVLKNTYMDEIGVLLGGFNEMSSSLEDLIEKNRTIIELQKESEIKLLENQINPHFLFNTLEIINSLILNQKETEAMKVCETLGQLYRYNLRQEKWISLREELDYTRQYLLIAEYKINDLEVYFDVDEKIMESKFLKMILQPLVENAIRHGFYCKTQDCCVSIRALQKGEKIRIEVMDNGAGIEEQQRKILMEELDQICRDPMKKLPESTHIGLRNIVQRLYLEYGEAFWINIVTSAGDGLRIEMEIPILQDAKGEKDV